MIPRILFGEGQFDNLGKFIREIVPRNTYTVFIVDSIHQQTGLLQKIPSVDDDVLIEADVSKHEPKTSDIDSIRDRILQEKKALPDVIVGIGGGSVMDIAKAVSVMLTNAGSAAEYQGWELVKKNAVPKIGVPTLSGTGAEASRTAVLTGPEKKLGINSDQSIFDAVLMDPLLIKTVPKEQEFFTGMDGFIHSVEALNGSAMNALGRPYAEKSKEAFEKFFLKEKDYAAAMVGSFFGGCSIANSSVGICHALSYGISWVLGFRHGVANSIVFNQLEEFYGDDVLKFQKMVKRHNICIPANVTKDVTPEQMAKMIEMTYLLKKDLISALGAGYRDILTPEKIERLYQKM